MNKNVKQIIVKMTMIAMLSALGSILMVFAEFPYLPAPWCMFEFSDTTVLVAYALYGLPGGAAVAIIKTLFSLLLKASDPYYIGQVAALIASFTYILGLFLCSHVFKWFKKGFGFRIASYVFITLLVSVVLTLLNMWFITPSYLSGYGWATCFSSDVIDNAMKVIGSFSSIYAVAIIFIYLPFNLLKGLMVTAAYELIFNRVIFVLMPSNPMVKEYFLGPIKFKKERAKKEEEKSDKSENNKDDQSLLEKIDSDDEKARKKNP